MTTAGSREGGGAIIIIIRPAVARLTVIHHNVHRQSYFLGLLKWKHKSSGLYKSQITAKIASGMRSDHKLHYQSEKLACSSGGP